MNDITDLALSPAPVVDLWSSRSTVVDLFALRRYANVAAQQRVEEFMDQVPESCAFGDSVSDKTWCMNTNG